MGKNEDTESVQKVVGRPNDFGTESTLSIESLAGLGKAS